MASQKTPKSQDQITLVALEQALRDVCQVLKAHDPDRDWDTDAEVQQATDAGVRDPIELWSRMLEGFGLDAPH
jgi:hypothetical protein